MGTVMEPSVFATGRPGVASVRGAFAGVAVAVAVACALGLVSVASAQQPEPSERELARQHYETGAAAYEAGDYATALVELDQSYDLFASLRTLYAIGLCQQALFDYVGALASFEQYVREGGGDIPADRRAEVDTAMAQMRHDMARLAVTVDVAGAEVFVDGVQRASSPLPEPIQVGPGVHVVEARLEGYVTVTQPVSVGAGRTEAVPLHLEAVPGVPTVIRIDTGGVVAQAYVDDAPVGPTPAEIEVAPGDRNVRIEADGYRPIARSVAVEEGRRQTVTFEMVPMPAAVEPPALGRQDIENPPAAPPAAGEAEEEGSLWWLWTTIGVVVAGGAVTAGLLLGLPEDPAYDERRRVR